MNARSRRASLAAGLVLGVGSLFLAGGCSSKPKPLPIPDMQREGCLVNSDCEEPLVCAFERCHVECVTTRDCDGTLRCVGAHEKTRVCQLESEAKCKSSVDCAQGFVCGQDGACRDSCQVSADCIGTQVCTKGVCAEPTELDPSGELPQTLDFRTCGTDADCTAGQRCLSHACQDECRLDRDCADGESCKSGACQHAAPVCTQDTDCTKAGQTCAAGQCRCACQADVDCAPNQTCDGCACQDGPAPECRADVDCDVGRRCLAGACSCECKQDRDCAVGQACDGCSCRNNPKPTSVNDATVRAATDIQLMQGIEEVADTLTITGNLSSTEGLESLRKVKNLTLSGWMLQYGDQLPDPLAGLANLTEISDTLTIVSTAVQHLSFNPKLKVGKTIVMQGVTSLTCADTDAFKTAIDFQGSFSVTGATGCNAACDGAACAP